MLIMPCSESWLDQVSHRLFSVLSLPPETPSSYKDGAGALKETAISFSVAVAVVTACFCTTMSCAALCIKCATWLFGHRGRRRRILLRSSLDDEELTGSSEQTLVQTPIAEDDNNDDEAQQQQQQQQQQKGRKAEIELRETPYYYRNPGGDNGSGAIGSNGEWLATPLTRSSHEGSASSPGLAPNEQEEGQEQTSGVRRLG